MHQDCSLIFPTAWWLYFPSKFILVFSFSAPLGCGKEPLRSGRRWAFCLLAGQAGTAWFSVEFLLPSFLHPVGVPELCRSSYFVFLPFLSYTLTNELGCVCVPVCTCVPEWLTGCSTRETQSQTQQLSSIWATLCHPAPCLSSFCAFSLGSCLVLLSRTQTSDVTLSSSLLWAIEACLVCIDMHHRCEIHPGFPRLSNMKIKLNHLVFFFFFFF